MNYLREVRRILGPSIGVALAIFLFSGWVLAEKTVKVRANYSDLVGLESVKKDLAKLDGYAASGNYSDAGVLIGQDIKARDVYRAYLTRADQMSTELLSVRQKFDLQNGTIFLQQLGALAQRLSLNNHQFKGTFRHGEDHFQTYHLIEKAVSNLEDAIAYWRIANHYNRFYRGGAQDKLVDDEILKTKLQTAMNAIDELKIIVETRAALTRDLTED